MTKIFLPLLGLFLVFSTGYARNPKNAMADTLRSQHGAFRIILPPGHSAIQSDSTLITTKFGGAEFYSLSFTNTKGAGMIAWFDLVEDNIKAAAPGLAQDHSALLDSLQQQLLANLKGKVQRQFKLMRENTLHSRTTYFTAAADKNVTTYIRCDQVYKAPRVYQILYTTTEKNGLDKLPVKRFFESFLTQPQHK
jgi:hypothetical protein